MPAKRNPSSSSPRKKAAKSSRSTAGRSLSAYKKLDFTSGPSLQRSLSRSRSATKNLQALMDAAHSESPTRGKSLARAFLSRQQTQNEYRETALNLTRWSTVPGEEGSARRRTVCRTFHGAKADLVAVHCLSQLPREEAREFMKSFLAEGGQLATITQWLQMAGATMRAQELAATPKTSRGKQANRKKQWGLGSIVDAVGGALSDAAGAVGDAVSTVVDAVVSAGKSVADAVAAAVSWTVEQVTDLIRAMLTAGRRVSEILDEALRRNVVKKFVQALIRAGRAASEALAWAVSKAAAVVKDVLAGLLNAGKTLVQLLSWVASRALSEGIRYIQGLIQLGRNVVALMAAATRLAAQMMRQLVGMILRATNALGSMLAAVARAGASVLRTVLEGLFLVGVTLVQMMAAICQSVAEGFRKGFCQALLALGHAVLDLLKAAVVTSLSVLGLAVAVFMEIWGGHRSLTPDERREATRIFNGSFDLDRVKIAVASIPADVANWLNGQRPFTTMYVINFASWAHVDMKTLIHELTHVWQGAVSGPIYMVEALHSQFFGNGYEVTPQHVAAANGDIRALEREQQAVVVEEYWSMRFGSHTTSLAWIPMNSAGQPDWTVLEPLAQDVAGAPRRTTPIRVGIPRLGIRIPRSTASLVYQEV